MNQRSIFLNEATTAYVSDSMTRENDLRRRLRAETEKLPMGMMQIGADQGAFLALLVKLVGARRTIEIGTFTGYSALVVADALPRDGKVIACDVSREWTDIARRYWKEAGVDSKIELRLAPASDTIAGLLKAGEKGKFDFAFIDADKIGYDAYYEGCLELLRPGGLIALDNMLWRGFVVDPKVTDEDTTALRALNAKIRRDERVDMMLATIGDGVVLARKR